MTATPLQTPQPAPTPASPLTDTPPASPLEATLEALLQSLLELGICASDVQGSALESAVRGVASGYPAGLVGKKTAQTVEHLREAYSLRSTGSDVFIPMDVIHAVDAGKNPHLYTRDFVERVAGENMYTNGILRAVTDYRELLTAQLGEAFPELAGAVGERDGSGNGNGIGPEEGTMSTD